jgi:hypothetical protein
VASVRAARRRHQQSPEGRLDHRDRQRAYRARRRVMDQGSPPAIRETRRCGAGLGPSDVITALHRLWAVACGAAGDTSTRPGRLAPLTGAMELEFHQLDLRYDGLRVRQPARERRLLASLAVAAQFRTPRSRRLRDSMNTSRSERSISTRRSIFRWRSPRRARSGGMSTTWTEALGHRLSETSGAGEVRRFLRTPRTREDARPLKARAW